MDSHRKRHDELELGDDHHPVQLPVADAALLVAQLRELAHPDEWRAATAYAEGLTGDELGEACGCAPFSARRRIARLRARIEGTAA